MKKLFSLVMFALLTIGANAQTLIDYPTSQDGITIIEGSSAEFNTVKIHSNKDEVSGIKLANSNAGNGVEVTVQGGFKAGDKIEIAGAFNNDDDTKEATVQIINESTVLFTTQQFVNGKTSASDPVAETYTLAADAESLIFARKGGTATYITLLKITRGTSTDNEEPSGPTETVILSWDEEPVLSSLTTEEMTNAGSADNVATWSNGYSIMIMRSDKGQGSAKDITINGNTYKTIKASNGAQNKLILPAGKVTRKITLYSYVNLNAATDRTAYWKEVAGVTYTEKDVFESYNDYTNPDKREYTFEATNEVTFTNTGEQPCYVVFVEVEDAPATTVEIPAIVSTTGYASFSSDKALDFTGIEGLEAYVISDISETSATLTQVTKVPENTGLILKGSAGETYTVNILDGEAEPITNKLVAATTVTLVDANSVYVVNEGALHPFSGTEIPAGKAYLPASEIPSSARVLNLVFGEATGISTVQSSKGDNAIYDLSGRRVEKLSKGIFVVNGQKIVVK